MALGGRAIQRRRRRTAAVIAGSFVVHALVLVAVGSHVPHADWRIRSLDQNAVVVELNRLPPVEIPLPPPPPPPPPSPTKSKHDEVRKPPEPAPPAPLPAPAPIPHLAPIPAPPPPPTPPPAPKPTPPKAPAAPPAAPTPTPAPVHAPPAAAPAPPAAVAGRPSPWLVAPRSTLPPGFANSLRTRTGCSDPKAEGLTPEEREACKDRLAEGARDAPFIQAPMAPEKRAAYDRIIRCRKAYQEATVPAANTGWGLGTVPSLKDCGPNQR